MRKLPRRLAVLAGSIVLVAGLLAVGIFAVRLLSGSAGVRSVVAAVVGIALVVAVARALPAPSLLGGYSAIVYACLFLPIVIVVVYAFNSGRYVAVWDGFSLGSFSAALREDSIVSSIELSFRIGVVTAIVSTILSPAVIAGGLLAFTFSFDDVVISNFTAGAGHETWPLHILSALRFGLSPTLNAAATLMIGVTLVGLALAGLAYRIGTRNERQEPA